MTCWCCTRRGGAGRQNTSYYWHLYECEYYLSDLDNYSYEEFKQEYKKLQSENKTNTELYLHFMKVYDEKLSERDNNQ